MSKLAHSNAETMHEIEMRSFGFSLIPKLKPPRCEADTITRWYRPNGGKCPYQAKWTHSSGRQFCNIHAEQYALGCEKS